MKLYFGREVKTLPHNDLDLQTVLKKSVGRTLLAPQTWKNLQKIPDLR
jgi:hypothetical protein